MIMSMRVTYKSYQRESKINYYSCFLSRGTSRLIKWICKERYELLLLKKKKQNKTKAPFKRGISYEWRTPILVDESN